jgi:hypothetical protein
MKFPCVVAKNLETLEEQMNEANGYKSKVAKYLI